MYLDDPNASSLPRRLRHRRGTHAVWSSTLPFSAARGDALPRFVHVGFMAVLAACLLRPFADVR